MIFWRIVDNKVYPIKETDNLGFEKSEAFLIPDEYLDKQEFMVMRTAHGIGDWGIVSSMPRLLKEKYPNCKVYVPTNKMITELFKEYNVNHNNSHIVFENNPYVDGFFSQNVFHTDGETDGQAVIGEKCERIGIARARHTSRR